MIGVDNHVGPRLPERQRGDATGSTGLRRVGMQYVRPAILDDSGERANCGAVGPDRQLALEFRDPHERQLEIVDEVLHRFLTVRNRSRNDEYVAASVELRSRQLGNMEGRSAHIQARDDVNHPECGGRAHWRTAATSRSGTVVFGLSRAGMSRGATATTPSVSQKTAANGTPPNKAAPARPPVSAKSHAAGT